MAHDVNVLEKRIHPATGEEEPVFFGPRGEQLPVCDNCGRMWVAEHNKVICKMCVIDPSIRGWYIKSGDFTAEQAQLDIDPYIEKMLTPEISPRVPNPYIEELEKRTYPNGPLNVRE